MPTTYDTASGDSTATDTAAAPDSGGTVQDAGPPDAGPKDAGPKDAGPKDAGPKDAGPKDAGPKDAGPKDAGNTADPLSCPGNCGAKYDKSLPCQCNDQCMQYGNCCKDYVANCAKELLSCKDRCKVAYDKSLPCQCVWDCSKFGSCCSDWVGHCPATKKLDYVEAAAGECSKAGDWVKVKSAKDGDTIELTTGEVVRFQIVNTPEIKDKQCFAYDARSYTWDRLKKSGYKVCLTKDPGQPDKDVYKRLLRYVYIQEPGQLKAVQLNARLVRLGYGRVFYPFANGNVHEKVALAMQEKARIEKSGGWGSCVTWK